MFDSTRIGLLAALCLVLAPLSLAIHSPRVSDVSNQTIAAAVAPARVTGAMGSLVAPAASGRSAPLGLASLPATPDPPDPSSAFVASRLPGAAAADTSHFTTGITSPYTSYQWIPLTGASLVGTDSNANYWIAFLTADPAITLTIAGTYPSVRYASIQAYDASGAYLTGLPDKDFPPDQGSVNPFVAGTPRGVGTYTLHVVFGPPPSPPAPGTLYINQPAGASVSLLYRLYLPDTGASKTGNVPLPTISTQSGSGVAPLVAPQEAQATALALQHAPPPPASMAATATPTPGFTRAAPGSYTNADEAYLAAVLPATTQLYVVRFAAPTNPHTLGGDPLDPHTQLRYWSVCVNNLLDYPYACRADEQVVLTSPHRQATIVIGLQSQRPTNATRAHGVTWISLGTIALSYAVLLRHLLPASSFTQSAFAVPVGAAPGPYMGPYAPTLVVCSTQQFEQSECK